MGATKGGTFTGAGQSTPRDLSPHKGYPDLQAIAVQRCLYHGLTRLTARSTLFSCLVVRRRRVKSTPKGRPLIMRYAASPYLVDFKVGQTFGNRQGKVTRKLAPAFCGKGLCGGPCYARWRVANAVELRV